MSVKYFEGWLQIHRLDLKTRGEMNLFIKQIREAIIKLHPNLMFNSDVEIDINCYAGKFDA